MSTVEHPPSPRSVPDTGAKFARPRPSEFDRHWRRDPGVVFLNHGSFGGLPIPVAQRQQAFRDQFQLEPIRFVVEELEPLLDEARRHAAAFVGCEPADFAFVTNATAGVNSVVRSLTFQPGDGILTNNHEYSACQNVLRWAADRWGAKVVVAQVPFPISSADEVYDRIVAAATDRTRLVLLSHVTSPTAIIFPVERIVAEMTRRGIDTLVDGAHAPGMLPLNVDRIGAAYYTGNFHKWVSAPPGAAFLFVRRDRQHLIRPLVISHGANSKRTDKSRFQLEFDFPATFDPSPWLCVPDAIRFMGSLLPGGWQELMRRNHNLAMAGQELLSRALGFPPPAPPDMIGSMAAMRIPDRSPAESSLPTKYHDPLQDALIARHSIQVPIIPFPQAPMRYVRISAQVYNTLDQYRYLADAIRAETARP